MYSTMLALYKTPLNFAITTSPISNTTPLLDMPEPFQRYTIQEQCQRYPIQNDFSSSMYTIQEIRIKVKVSSFINACAN